MTDPANASSSIPPDASGISIESGVGYKTRLGFVKLRWGDESGQLTTSEARQHAYAILEAAAAADHDAAVYRWLIELGPRMPEESAAVAIAELRRARAIVDQESGND